MKKVAQYDPETGERIAVYRSLTAAAAVYGSASGISQCCNGKIGTAYGCRWRFVRLNRFGDYVVVPPERKVSC